MDSPGNVSGLSDGVIPYQRGAFAEKFATVLRETGFYEAPPAEEFLWMEDVEGIEPFLELFTNSITPQNYLNDNELTFLKHMFNPENAQDAKDKLEIILGPAESRSCCFTDDNIAMMEEEVERLKKEIQQAKHINNAMDLELTHLNESNKASSGKLARLKKSVEALEDECTSLHSALTKTCKLYADDCTAYQSQLLSKSDPPVRLTQISFDEFNQHNALIAQEIHDTFVKNFNQLSQEEEKKLKWMGRISQNVFDKTKELEISLAEQNLRKSLLLEEKRILDECFENNTFPSLEELREIESIEEDSSLLLSDQHLKEIEKFSKQLVEDSLVDYKLGRENKLKHYTKIVKEVMKYMEEWRNCKTLAHCFVEREAKTIYVACELVKEATECIEKFSSWFESSKIEVKQAQKFDWKKALISCWDMLDGSPRTQVHLEDVLDALKKLADDLHSQKLKGSELLKNKQIVVEKSLIKFRNQYRELLLSRDVSKLFKLEEDYSSALKLQQLLAEEIDPEKNVSDELFKVLMLFFETSPVEFAVKILQLEEKEELLENQYKNYLKDKFNVNDSNGNM